MAQRPKRRYVFLGIQLICLVVILGIMYHDYRHQGGIAVVGDLGFYFVIACLNYTKTQGEKLADANMRKAGLKQDRD